MAIMPDVAQNNFWDKWSKRIRQSRNGKETSGGIPSESTTVTSTEFSVIKDATSGAE